MHGILQSVVVYVQIKRKHFPAYQLIPMTHSTTAVDYGQKRRFHILYSRFLKGEFQLFLYSVIS